MKNNSTNRAVFDRYLTETELNTLFKHVNKFKCLLAQRDLHWMRLLNHTGMRVQTLSQLTVGDAHIALSTNYIELRDEICKGGRGYRVYIGKRARKAVKGLLSTLNKQGYTTTNHEAPLMMSRNHKAISVRSLQIRMKKWVLESGINPKASPHWFRHSMAKRVLNATTSKHPMQAVQICLGHSDSRSTEIYTLTDKEEIERVMQEVG